jgi:hypothetical protein
MRLNARLIEQWLLKTTINLSLQQPGSGLDITDELVRRAFGLAPTPARQGFFVIAELRERLGPKKRIHFETMVRKEDRRVVWSAFVFHGLRMAYAFDGAPKVVGTIRIRQIGDDGGAQFFWDPEVDTSEHG